MNKTILVTGANGQLGRAMQRVSASSQDRYIFTDVVELDITSLEAISEVVSAEKVDVIVNCAAYTNVEKAESEPDKANLLNNIAVGYLAKAATEVGATLIHISTDYVFDGSANKPYTEQSEANPIGVYGRTKLAGEQNIAASGCQYIIIRTSWLYASWGDNFYNKIKQLTAERDSLSVVDDQVGSPTLAGDLAKVIAEIIATGQLNKTGVYHYSNEGVCSWFEFAKAICEKSGNSCEILPISSCDYPTKVARPNYSVLDKTKIKATFGIEIPHWRKSLEHL